MKQYNIKYGLGDTIFNIVERDQSVSITSLKITRVSIDEVGVIYYGYSDAIYEQKAKSVDEVMDYLYSKFGTDELD